jgi:gliding motility-associated-like protein
LQQFSIAIKSLKRENSMNMKNKRIFLVLWLIGIIPINAYSQYEVTGLGDIIYVMANESVWVRGAGGVEIYGNCIFDNQGTIIISGNWKNNGNTNGFVSNRPTGTLYLDGADQRILGSRSTVFNNLTLAGTGVKFLDVDCSNENILKLNDREFRLGPNNFTVQNTSLNAITRAVNMTDNSLSGFVSATNGGYLARAMNVVGDYIFPVGDIIQGSPRYRPVIIRPTAANANIFGVRMANVDATTEGYDRDKKDTTICIVNPDFYHQIYRVQGTDPADIAFAYDDATDAIKQFMARWDGALWRQIVPSTPTVNPGTLSFLNIFAWDDFKFKAFAMANEAAYAHITAVNPPAPLQGIPVYFEAGFYPGQTYTWEFGDGSTGTGRTISHTFTAPGVYVIKLTVVNSAGCEDVDYYKIEIPKIKRIYDPTGVTPNGDGINDVLEIPLIGYDAARMFVFDRWGVIVKEVEMLGSKIIWDATDKNGNPVQEDAYVYRIDATTPDGQVDTIVSTVTVIR